MGDEEIARVVAGLEKILTRIDAFTEEVRLVREQLDAASLAWANDQRDYRARMDVLLAEITERLDHLERRDARPLA